MKRKPLRINFQVIPRREQRYPTVGDWWQDKDGVWQFRVTRMGNLFYEILVFVHELVEWAMCQAVGITVEEVDKFDIQFEKDRAAGKYSKDAEPGDSPLAPYCHQHRSATRVERLAATMFGVDWETYSRAVDKS